jgi:copper(I)-binding protein
MNRTRILTTAVFALALMISVPGSSVIAQHDHGHGNHSTPEASPMAGAGHGDHGADLSMGALYLVITNEGDDTDRLVSVTTDAAEFVEVHQVNMDNNVMQMEPLHEGLELPAGEQVALEPGGSHIMLIGLTESLIAGEDYELIMTFEHAGEITVTVPILRTEPDDDEGKAGPVEVGELVIDGMWSRQAPKIDGGVVTPAASPESTPAH